MAINKYLRVFLLGLITLCSSVQGTYIPTPVPPLSAQAIDEATVNEYLMPEDHPARKKLKKLFKNPKMFKSVSTLSDEGFSIHPRVHDHMMVAKHPKLKKYIFKKYKNSVPPTLQLRKYMRRAEGAKMIQNYIKENDLKYIVVPKKWLYQLPPEFDRHEKSTYIVVAEYMDICSGGDDPRGEIGKRYHNMKKKVLKELCQIMHDLGGCDAWPRNQPFTRSGQIAFVDTEHVGQKKGHFFKYIIPMLNQELQEYAKAYWFQLEYSSEQE